MVGCSDGVLWKWFMGGYVWEGCCFEFGCWVIVLWIIVLWCMFNRFGWFWICFCVMGIVEFLRVGRCGLKVMMVWLLVCVCICEWCFLDVWVCVGIFGGICWIWFILLVM